MKFFKILLCAFFAGLSISACDKKEIPDTTPAVLKSVAALAADNPVLSADVKVAEISENMQLYLPGIVKGQEIIFTFTAGENDLIEVNNQEVGENGKIAVDVTFPINIIVTNSKSKLSSSFTVKFDRSHHFTFETTTYTEPDASIYSDVAMRINPKDGAPYVAYNRTDATVTKRRCSIVKWNGSALVPVGNLGFTAATSNANPVALEFDPDGVPYFAYLGGDVNNFVTLAKFDGSTWNLVGEAGALLRPGLVKAVSLFFEPGTKKPIALVCDGAGTTGPSNKNRHISCAFDGSAWTTSLMQDSPVPNSSDKIYYYTATEEVDGVVYGVSSYNGDKYYVYKYENKAWSLLSKDFTPEGNIQGVPYNLDLQKDSKGNLFALLADYAGSTMHLYKLDKTTGAFTPYGPAIEYKAGSRSADPVVFKINPKTDEIIVAKVDKTTGFPMIAALDDELKLNFTKISEDTLRATSNMFLDITPDGVCYLTYLTVLKGADGDVTQLKFVKVGDEKPASGATE